MSTPKTMAVIGGGTMGAGIAQVFAVGGADVTVVEGGADAAEAAQGRIAKGVRRAAELGKLTGAPDEVLSRIRLVTDVAELVPGTELVVEAVPEVAELKVRVLAAAERVIEPGAVLASNTSALPVTELGAGLEHPERFLGMHFFNPVPASKLVEVVVGERTEPNVRDAVLTWVRSLNKTGIVVRDSPGFATSRLGVLLGLEAIRMLEDGVADAESIDAAMELGYRHPVGPLRSTDLVGLDVRLAIAEHLHATLGDRFAPPRLLREKVARGELGKKAGQGFFTWD